MMAPFRLDETWVYESADGGVTVTRRRPGSLQKQVCGESTLNQWKKILAAAEHDTVLNTMIEQVKIYHILKQQP